MKLYSTNSPDQFFSLREAVFRGLPADNGLFMPESIDPMPEAFFNTIEELSFIEIAFAVSKHLFGSSIEETALRKIIKDAFDFDIPLVPITSNIYSMELYHGPTLAFKDFGARFMARLMSHFLGDDTACILVATSGDTGSAVAQGFYKVQGIDVVILYPAGKVSTIQEQQLTTVGENVVALEVAGTFDDCQNLVKTAFLDQDLRQACHLSSANSINIARLIPQTFYYFWMYAQLKQLSKPIYCSVPSGNFGNVMGGLMAKKMGVPISKFIASNNANRVFYDFLQTHKFQPKSSVATISNAMDVGNPSNFVRIMDIYKQDIEKLSQDVVGYTFDDAVTKSVISAVYKKYNYILDPHGAVGYLGLTKALGANKQAVGVFLETAHPVKFLSVVQPLVEQSLTMPSQLETALGKEKKSVAMANSFPILKQYLLGR